MNFYPASNIHHRRTLLFCILLFQNGQLSFPAHSFWNNFSARFDNRRSSHTHFRVFHRRERMSRQAQCTFSNSESQAHTFRYNNSFLQDNHRLQENPAIFELLHQGIFELLRHFQFENTTCRDKNNLTQNTSFHLPLLSPI